MPSFLGFVCPYIRVFFVVFLKVWKSIGSFLLTPISAANNDPFFLVILLPKLLLPSFLFSELPIFPSYLFFLVTFIRVTFFSELLFSELLFFYRVFFFPRCLFFSSFSELLRGRLFRVFLGLFPSGPNFFLIRFSTSMEKHFKFLIGFY